jgi:nucleoside-diphosphate-sugar epimerase
MIVTIARLFGVYGPRQKNRLVPRLVEAVLRRTPIRIESHPTEASDVGGLRISLCHVEDVVEVFIKLVSARPVDCINVAGPEALSVREIAETIGSYVGQSPIFEKVSKARRSDFIADTSLLRAVCPHSFIPFKKAVGPVVESIRAYVSEESS